MCTYYLMYLNLLERIWCTYMHVYLLVFAHTCALIETLYDYCPSLHAKPWWQSTAQVGTKLLYLPKPDHVLYVVPLSHILGKLPLVLAGDDGTIPRQMHCRKDACYPLGMCDRQGSPGTGSPLFYINSWAMIWSVDYKKDGH